MKYPLLAVLLLLFNCQIWASSPSLRFEEITLKNGLSQATVLDILQDDQGFMWFATQDGLNRYDGYDFVVYRHDQDNINSLSENYINNVFQDSQGQLWLTTRNGLNRFDPSTNEFTRFYHDIHNPNSLSANWTFGVIEDRFGRIWVGTYNSGINIYDPKTKVFTALKHDPQDSGSLGDNGIYDMFMDASGDIWVATRNGGVSRYNVDKETFTRFEHDPKKSDSISHNKVYRIFQGADDRLWFATRGGGLNLFDPDSETFKRYLHDPDDPNSISGDQVWSVAEDSHGDLLVGTMSNGLNRLSRKTGKFTRIAYNPSIDHAISGNSILALFVDSSDTLWLSIHDVGLNRLNQDTVVFNHYRHVPSDPLSLSDNSVQAFLKTRDGDIYVGTRDGGINLFDPLTNKFTRLHQVDNPQHKILFKSMNQILEDGDGFLWIALKDDGLVRYDPKTTQVKVFTHDPADPKSLSDDTINALLLDGAGNMWVATSRGLNLFNLKTFASKAYFHDEKDSTSLGSDWVTSLLIDHNRQLWVGTLNGLNSFDGQTETFYHLIYDPTEVDSLSGNSVVTIYEDSNNNLWVATTTGLNKYMPQTSTFERIQKKDGLSNSQTYGVVEDNDAHLWVMTNLGLNRYDPQSGSIRLFTEDDGLQGNEFNQGAFYKLPDGRLMFGGVNGFNLFDPRAILDNPYPPQVTLTNFRVFNQSVPVGLFGQEPNERALLSHTINFTDEITLTNEDSVISFEFSALHYAAPTLNRYSYRLVGFDQDWTTTDYKNRRVTYTNLASGKYTFEVKASNKDRVWSDEPVSISITIQSPWWLGTGAKFFWLVLFFMGIILIFRLKTDQIRKQREQLQQQVTWQVAQVVAQKKALETSYDDIRIISDVGQKINASLDIDKVLWTVYEAINKLMDGTVFGIGLYFPEKKQIRVELAMEKGKRYKPYFRSMENKNQFPVWCIENDADIFVNDLAEDGHKYLKRHEYEDDDDVKNKIFLEDGAYSGAPQSLIYVPIKSQDTILGFMTVQSFNRQAYRHVHVDILHTLAAYTSTAIENSRAHQKLLDNKQKQVESEKMASLGALVAGIAHEIDTPVGNCLTTASAMEFEADQLFSAKRQGKLTTQKFNQFEEKLNLSMTLLLNNLHKTSNLIANFEGVVVDLATEVKSTFNVRELLSKTLQTLRADLTQRHIKLDLNCEDDFLITTYSNPITRVISTLVMNSLMHAFEEDNSSGKITITVTMVGEELHIRYMDDGKGMETKLSERIFDPFYTTRRRDGCLGLGMHIVYNQVSQGLNGMVGCHSALGEGMQIFINIPAKN
jgi:ligand-binding sensor domain-containing protein/signal transduction histidine kinase